MEEKNSGAHSGYEQNSGETSKPGNHVDSKSRTAEGQAQTQMSPQEVEERLLQMRDRGEIGMSQYNLARQDLLKYGVRFEDLPYLFVGKELPLDLTKESRRWYNARLPRDEAVKLLKLPNITAGKLKVVREHYSTLPGEEVLLEALASQSDEEFLKFLEDYKTRSNPAALSRRMDKIERKVDTMEKSIGEIGTNIGEVKKTVELLKSMFQAMKEQEEEKTEEKSDAGELQKQGGNAGSKNDLETTAEETDEEGEESRKKKEKPAEEEKNSDEAAEGSSSEERETKVRMQEEKGLEESYEYQHSVENGPPGAEKISSSVPADEAESETGDAMRVEEPEPKAAEMKNQTNEESTQVKRPAFFEKLLPGFYHVKKKEYIQLKQRERERKDHLDELQRMADDLYTQDFMDEETYFIFCELAFKEQALDKDTAELLIDGIKRGIPFALLFKVVRNVKNSSDWEASVNLLESLIQYQKQNDERTKAALKT